MHRSLSRTLILFMNLRKLIDKQYLFFMNKWIEILDIYQISQMIYIYIYYYYFLQKPHTRIGQVIVKREFILFPFYIYISFLFSFLFVLS
jgi:hypothetical protein